MNEDTQIAQSYIDKLNPMMRQYLATALWSSHDFAKKYGLVDIDMYSILRAERDCKQFEILTDIAKADFSEARDMGQVGHDFWLTRNGHGAGFYDGDYPIFGDVLGSIASTFKNIDLVLGDDNKIYFE